jgi:hypothetical protein
MSHEAMSRLSISSLPGILFAGAVLTFLGAGCSSGDEGSVRLKLHTQKLSGGDGRQLRIHAEVTGDVTGLRYKWFAIAGECEPQESDSPEILFKFTPDAKRDRIAAEAWRKNQRVGQDQIEVNLPDDAARRGPEELPKVGIEITRVPPYEPEGGPNTRSEIAGKVSGEIFPEHKVVIYARADAWYMQPTAYATHAIAADRTWGSWTHTGSSYAALVVRPGFDPFLRLDVLPQVGGNVLARTIVEGKRKE